MNAQEDPTSGVMWIGTSWKMNKSLAEARDYATVLGRAADPGRWPGVQPFVIPPATALSVVRDMLSAQSDILLGAQNAHWEDQGAWTGEVSVPQVADAGARLVEIGHSERRMHFGETIATTRLKVAATLRHGLIPLLCVGEPLGVKEAGRSAEHILEQAAGALDGLLAPDLARVLIAYEPIWAIGEGGRPATPSELAGPFLALDGRYGGKVSGLLYGGSVNLDNADVLLGIEGVSGLFVGRAALDVSNFFAILDVAAAHVAS